ncbi:MAG: DNA repair protein RecO [Prevotella sp.]|nr:DNA repair protein RecO [Prevotella sp.]
MMTQTDAIVLNTIKYGDSQIIVDMFTEQYGRISFICHVPKTAKAKVRKNLFQPMNLLDLSFDYRVNRQLQHIKDVRLSYFYRSIPFEPNKLAITLFLSEFLDYSTRDEQQNVPLYHYISMSMRWLDECQRGFSNFHLVFMMRLTKFIGFYPNLDHYVEGALFDLRNSCFCTNNPLHQDVLQPHEASKINLLMRMNYDTMHLFRMSHHERNRCLETILAYYKLHIPNFSELKSLDVMRELFA